MNQPVNVQNGGVSLTNNDSLIANIRAHLSDSPSTLWEPKLVLNLTMGHGHQLTVNSSRFSFE